MREYKRYTIGNVLTKCSGLRENGRFMTFDEVVNLLNTQYNLIQSLQKTNDVLEENQERLNNQLKLSYQKITDLKEDLNDLNENPERISETDLFRQKNPSSVFSMLFSSISLLSIKLEKQSGIIFSVVSILYFFIFSTFSFLK